MDFRLSDEQTQIQQMVRDFALSEIKPHLMEWDEAQHFPTEVFKRAGASVVLLPSAETYTAIDKDGAKLLTGTANGAPFVLEVRGALVTGTANGMPVSFTYKGKSVAVASR